MFSPSSILTSLKINKKKDVENFKLHIKHDYCTCLIYEEMFYWYRLIAGAVSVNYLANWWFKVHYRVNKNCVMLYALKLTSNYYISQLVCALWLVINFIRTFVLVAIQNVSWTQRSY